jgi:16S rRNA (guanine1516-N2)-methyltransferase
MAESFARKTGAPIVDKPGEYLTIHFDSKGVSLSGFGLTYQGDFAETMMHRVTNGRLQHEMLVKAASSEKEGRKAIDATAGMGEDAFLLAAQGYEVTLYEQNPVVAALLKDAIRRAKKNQILKDIAGRMKVVEADSVESMSKLLDPVDVIYLDPMFPARQKSSLINKKLQLIQKLEPPCSEETDLFDAALKVCPSRIIVKRPLKSECLAGREPSYTLKGKAIRYDCYVL